MKATTREWIEKAEADFMSACREYRARNRPNFDASCFFAQQSIEKYLKGRLAEASRPIPKTHDLSVLLDSVVVIEPLWEDGHCGCAMGAKHDAIGNATPRSLKPRPSPSR